MTNSIVHVVTVVKDDLVGFQRTLGSLSRQQLTRAKLRVLIVDSSSTNEIVDALLKYPNLETEYFYTNPKGVYSAMNTALDILEAKSLNPSDSVLFLNSGDFLLGNDALEILKNENIENSVIACHAAHLNKNIYPKVLFPSTYTGTGSQKLNPLEFWIPHQGLMVQLNICKQVGKFDETLTIASDYDWIIRANAASKIKVIPDVLVVQVLNGISNARSYSGYKQRKTMASELGFSGPNLQMPLIAKMRVKEWMFVHQRGIFELYYRALGSIKKKIHEPGDGCAWCIYEDFG